MKQALKYCYKPKHKITPIEVEEIIELLNNLHKPSKTTESPLQLWRTLFKYNKFITPSGSSKMYSPYSFPGDGYSYISFATSIEKYQVYEEFKTIQIFPRKDSSPLQILSYCQILEKILGSPEQSKIGGFSFNPKATGGFFTFSFLNENPHVLSLMESVNIEDFIRYLIETKNVSFDEMTEQLTSNTDLYMQVGNLVLPMFLPYLNLFKHEMYAVSLSDNMIAISGSKMILLEVSPVHITLPLNEILQLAEKEKKTLLLWYEHNDAEEKLIINPEDCSLMLKKLYFIEDCNEMLRESFKNNIKIKK